MRLGPPTTVPLLGGPRTARFARRTAGFLLGTAGCLLLAATGALGTAGCLPAEALPREFRLSTRCPKGTLALGSGLCRQDIPYNRPGLTHTGLVQPVPAATIRPRVADLGRLLFFDPILSESANLSCAHCHDPVRGWSDGRAVSRGFGAAGRGPTRTGGVPLRRSAPGLWNVSFQQRLFWDGRATTLEDQAEGPLFHQDEMRMNPQALATRLQSSAYAALFRDAFGAPRISALLVQQALAEFQRTLVSFRSRYDRYALGDRTSLDATELRGFNVFRSFVTRCAECHPPPLFTNQQDAIIGAPESKGLPFDPGIEELTGSAHTRGAFRIPGIRNVGITAPFMHSGGLATLTDVVEFYDRGGGRALSAPHGALPIHWHVRRIGLSAEEKLALVAFLRTLTDESSMPEVPRAVPSGLPVLDGGTR